ncbi:nuclease-related domain-containing DEAD/DEAH box helicase [soil metagenome]
MAIFPQGLSHVDSRCNAGERRVLHQLKRCLGDDYWVWHDIPLGPRARQPDFVVLSPRWGILLIEVKDWKRSTLVGATRDAVELATPRGRVTQAHPLRQARDYAMELVDLMQRDPALVHAQGLFKGKLLFPYGWGVVLSNVKREDVAESDFDELFPVQRTLLRNDLDATVDEGALQQRLWGMFTLHYPHTLTLPQRDRIRWHLFPEIRLAQQVSLLEDDDSTPSFVLPDLLQVMDLQQEQIARTLGEGHRVIHGVAGSGKTMILIFRAQQLAAGASAGKPILVLCYNNALAARIDAQLRSRGVDERVKVRTFHAWCEDLVRSYQLDVPAERRAADYWALLAKTVARAVESGFVPGGQYTALLIDEAHDFEDAWLQVAARMVSPDSRSLLVLYDDTQSIYQKKRKRFNFASVGIEAVGRTSILRMNYRNTAEVLAVALQCASHLIGAQRRAAETIAAEGPGEQPVASALRLAVARGSSAATPAGPSSPDTADAAMGMEQVHPDSAGRRGAMPVLIVARHERDEGEAIAQRIADAQANGRPLQEIAILVRTRFQMPAIESALRRRGIAFASMNDRRLRPTDWAAASVKVITLHSAKGLEFPHVFIAGRQAMPHRGEALDEEIRLLYVGMTRATHELVFSAHGRPSVMVEKVQEAIAAVGARFARSG